MVGVIVIAILYYFTVGSSQITEEMKNTCQYRVEHDRNKNGFTVDEREVKPKNEHFILTFDDPEKIVKFFKQQGTEVALEDAEALKGLQIGVDLQYLNDTYSALSVDMYPLNLPSSITNAQDIDASDKALIKQLNDMLSRKALLVHVDFNKVLSSFKGYVKDIHETFKVETIAKIDLEGTTFEGTIKDDRITTLIQNIKNIHVKSEDELDIVLGKLNSSYTLTGKSIYDSTYNYKIGSVIVSGKKRDKYFFLFPYIV